MVRKSTTKAAPQVRTSYRYVDGSAVLRADEDIARARAASEGEPRVKLEDKLLDEIDSVLEKNAEEFVRNYIQKGGQ